MPPDRFMSYELLGILAALFGILGGLDYVLRIFGRTLFGRRASAATNPRAATWIVWAVVGTILASAYSSSGANETAWAAWALAIEYLVISILTITYDGTTRQFKSPRQWLEAINEIDQTERKCLIGAALAGTIWIWSGEPLLALLGAYAVDLFAAWPTIRQARYQPTEEPYSAWVYTVVGNLFNILAVSSWTLTSLDSFAVWSYPVYMLVVNGMILLLLTTQQFGGARNSNGYSGMRHRMQRKAWRIGRS